MVHLNNYIQEKNITKTLVTEGRLGDAIGKFFKWLWGEKTDNKYDVTSVKYDAKAKETYIQNSNVEPEVKLLTKKQVEEILKRDGAANTDPNKNAFNNVYTFINDARNSEILNHKEGQWAGWYFSTQHIHEFYILTYFYRETSSYVIPLFIVKEAKTYACKTNYKTIVDWFRKRDSRILDLELSSKAAKTLINEIKKFKDDKLKEDKENKQWIYTFMD